MGVHIRTEIHCDRCGRFLPFSAGHAARINAALTAAHAQSWTVMRLDQAHERCICPACNGANAAYWRIERVSL